MAIKPSILIFSAAAGVSVPAGGYFLFKGLNSSNNKTLKDKLWESLMLASDSSDKWDERKKILESASPESLVEDLRRVKENKSTEELKSWCLSNASVKFTDDKDRRYLNVKAYCTYKVKDKLSKAAREQGDNDWATASNKVKNPVSGVTLSDAMEKVKTELTKNNPNNDALKNWCKDVLDSMYENNSNFRDANSYCTKG
ncbi:hypothetical protein MHC_02070 [Mycoplasma haemocanis str. Illinois]|uniref:Uncharacterized protein n=1 Tax=Mycoplasma haemocanis (strain Illinois) TaxID=1111676 RepID=H6N6K8_MYCHN|nr:hypothetical protein [Mycoplasma haemocanis]AEW45280.1 hypothetical protein MHC_02070 [Mycoplasma haemocanis str. Illinois]